MAYKSLELNKIKKKLGINKGGEVISFLADTCLKHMDKYLPYDTGTLSRSAFATSKEVVYPQQYAEVVYKGIREGRPLNYHTDKHSKAGPYWDRRMKSAEMDDVVKEVKDFMKKRGVK